MSRHYTSSLPRRTQPRPRITSDVFRPPDTPQSASISYLSQSNGIDTPPVSRKRPRADGPDANFETPYAASEFSPWANSREPRSTQSSSCLDPPPLANERYRLAGGLDTPAKTTLRLEDDLGRESNHDYRSRWQNGVFNDKPTGIHAFAGERDGPGQIREMAEDEQPTWSRFVLEVVGNVAGKVWEFCRTSAFGGFTAGGGDVFPFSNDTETRNEMAGSRHDQDESPAHLYDGPQSRSQSRQEQFHDCISPENTDIRPAKRLQTSQGNGWVMINHNNNQAPSSHQAAPSTSPLRQPQSPSHRSLLPRPATSKANTTRAPRHSTSHYSSATYHAGSPTKRTASFAQPRSPVSMSPSAHRTPASAERRRIPVRREQEDWEGDEDMKKLNQQLKAMIREGKAALATRVEVGGGEVGARDLEDEGYAEGSDGTGKGW